MDKDAVRQLAAALLGMELTEAESSALAGALDGASRNMALLPANALKDLPPALVSVPGPVGPGRPA